MKIPGNFASIFFKKEQVKTQIASDLQFRILDLLTLHVKSNLTKREFQTLISFWALTHKCLKILN